MINQDLFKAPMSIVHGTSTPRYNALRYHVTNSKILHEEIKMEYIQEEWDNPLV